MLIRWSRYWLSALLLIAGGTAAQAEQLPAGFLSRTLGDYQYQVFVPHTPPPAEGYPLILFLHSAGERGTDGHRQVDFGLGPAIRQRVDSFGGIVVFPQADFADGPILETWRAGEPGGTRARDVLADVERQWPVDPERRAITGWSMGAYGALSLAAADPQHFSKVLAIAGGGEAEWGPALSTLPVWLVHGDRDTIVPPTESRALVSAFPEPHMHFYFTDVPGAAHDVWRSVYDSDEVLEWLTSADGSEPPVELISAPEPIDPHIAGGSTQTPFQPALVISRAISLRLGNDALQTLAAGVPQALEEERIRGELPQVEDRVEFDGRTYDVRFSGMTYRGRLQRAVLRGQTRGRLQVAFALRDLEVRIGSIEVSNDSDGVVAGPVSVMIGHREPVWMELQVRPAASPDGTLRLKLLESAFAIGDHNWYVGKPQQIRIRGQLFTDEVVTTAIVGGVYQRKSLIEQKILGAVESILQQVEQRVDFSPLSRLVVALWPLPVYQPRLRVRLEETSTDANGLSLVFGCEVAAPDSAVSNQTVPHVAASIPPAGQIEAITGLRAAVAVDVMQHLSAMMAGTDAMSLYAADVPGRPFRELDNPAGLTAALAGHEARLSLTDVRARLSLSEPFGYSPLDAATTAPNAVQMSIDVPSLSLTIFGKENDSDATWSRIAERELMVQQPLQLVAQPQLNGPTGVTVSWRQDATIESASEKSSGQRPDALVERFRVGWRRWAGEQEQSYAGLGDVAVGPSTLRLNGLAWQGECLTAEFLPAATVLVNHTDRKVRYCVRSENSRWGRPQTLAPHTQHVFRSGVPMQIRDAARWSRNGERLDLGTYSWTEQSTPAGQHWIAIDPAPAVGGATTVAAGPAESREGT